MVRELASLLRAGVTLEESLRTLIESRRGLVLEAPLNAVLSLVLAGERFSAAMRAQTEQSTLALPSYVVALISAGESTGDLAGALGRAAEQLEFDEQVRAETSEALVYPIILLAAGTGAVLFVFSFVVPRFSTLLAGRHADLPWLSSVVMGTGEFVNRHGTAIAIALLPLPHDCRHAGLARDRAGKAAQRTVAPTAAWAAGSASRSYRAGRACWR